MTSSSDPTGWFECITGFPETDYRSTRDRLQLEGDSIVNVRDGSRHGFGEFQMVSLQTLRSQSVDLPTQRHQIRIRLGDARALHAEPALAGATFQVASQFNMLEMVGPDVTPEHGVSRYVYDRTQGPACAVAAGAGTIWRNYCVPVPGSTGTPAQTGQSAKRQLDGLAEVQRALANRLGMPVSAVWQMRNGYAWPSESGLRAVCGYLKSAPEEERDALRSQLIVGWHRDVEVTDMPQASRQRVEQVYCSALPVAYSGLQRTLWEPFARLILQAAYEATLRAACVHASTGGSRSVLLTGLGGGAFGNDPKWISEALQWALERVPRGGLDIVLVGYGTVPEHFRAFESR